MLTIALAALVLPAVPIRGSTCCPPCTTVPPMLYSEIVAEAQQIVIGTATASSCRLADGGKTIRTFVTLDRLSWIKGNPEPSLTLQLEGGRIGDTRLQLAEMPELKVGSRYLLYVAHNGTNLSPVVGFFQGVFEIVVRDSREILVAHGGRELIGITNDRLVLAGQPVAAAAAGTAPPPAVAVPGFQPRPAAPDAEQRQRAEQAQILAHDRIHAERPLPERSAAGSAATPAAAPSRREPSTPPERSSAAAQPAAAQPRATEAMLDKSPITLPADQDRGSRISIQSLLDTAPIQGRR